MSHFQRTLKFYGIYREIISKQDTLKVKILYTIYYVRGTILTYKFNKRAFVNSRGKVKVHRSKGGNIDVEHFVSLSPKVMLAVCSCDINKPANLKIGSMSHIGERTEIHCGNKITIGRHVRIGWDCVIMDHDYHPLPGELMEKTAPIIIEDNVWIGCRAIILKGVTIGHDAIIGSGSVVTKSVQPCTLVAGNPATIKRNGLKSSPLPLDTETLQVLA